MTAADVARGDGEPRGSLPLVVVLLLPIVFVNTIGFLVPVFNLARMSLFEAQGTGAMQEVYTLATWLKMISDSFYAELILNTVVTSLFITLMTLLCSYPIALYVHRSSGLWRSILLVLVIAPLLTSAVVRTFGWIVILFENGLVNNALAGMGFRVIGIDPFEASARIGTRVAQEYGLGEQVTFLVGAGGALPIRAGSFDSGSQHGGITVSTADVFFMLPSTLLLVIA